MYLKWYYLPCRPVAKRAPQVEKLVEPNLVGSIRANVSCGGQKEVQVLESGPHGSVGGAEHRSELVQHFLCRLLGEIASGRFDQTTQLRLDLVIHADRACKVQLVIATRKCRHLGVCE